MPSINYVKNIAIVGATGRVGRHIVNELLAGGKHSVTAITRGNTEAPAGVRVAKVSYDDAESLKKALEGQDVLITTLSVTAPKDTQAKLVEAAAAANVPFILPNEWGIESSHGTLGTDTFMGPASAAVRRRIEELGKSAWIGMTTGYWFMHSLASPEAYGFDLKNKSVTFFDEGKVKINSITWEKSGQAVAALLSLPIKPETPGAPALSDYKNRRLYVSSWLMSQKDIFQHVLRVSGTKESDWSIKYEPAVERYEEAKKRLVSGDRSAYQRMLYTRTFYDNGDGDFETRHGLDNDRLGLAKETQGSLDEEIKEALKLAEGEGYKY
ncbi:putative oxidoreductase CipA [Astrocystis sublimbata]|nr:putative oxidoreductase CipA [Astrocystis sublimbata]